MLTLWYIILGWKEYNKSFRKGERAPKPEDPDKKPDLIPQKKDVIPTPPRDIKKPEPPKSIPIGPGPPPPKPNDSSFFNTKAPETPKIPESKPSFSTPKTPEVPETLKIQKVPEPTEVAAKTPKTPKTPELIKVPPKTNETPKMPEASEIPPKAPDASKISDIKLAPEAPKTPKPSKFPPESPEPSKLPEGLSKMMPSRRPDSVMPDFPPSTRNPAYVPPPQQSEFPIPPYLPGPPQNKPISKDDELFSMGSAFSNPTPNRPSGNLRDLSYAKGEFPREEVSAKAQDNLSRIPKYMEQSVISNPDSLESDEDF